MDDERARKALNDVLEVIDEWGDVYDRRWGHKAPQYEEHPELASRVDSGLDMVRTRVKLAHDVIVGMREPGLAAQVVEHEEGQFGRGHPFNQARVAIVEAIAILANREELAEITGPAGPRLSASALHPAIWRPAAKLWDNGHFGEAVQKAGIALEGVLQAIAGAGLSGENLAILFSLNDPAAGSPRLRIRDIDPSSRTWKSAHEGAAFLVRGAFMAVRNLVSHPGWPEPDDNEALEMLAVLSYVAHLIDRCDVKPSP